MLAIMLHVLSAAVKPVLFISAEMERDASSSVRNDIFMTYLLGMLVAVMSIDSHKRIKRND